MIKFRTLQEHSVSIAHYCRKRLTSVFRVVNTAFLDEMYAMWQCNKKTKEFKILKQYLVDNGWDVGGIPFNPYHVYNHFYVYNSQSIKVQVI